MAWLEKDLRQLNNFNSFYVLLKSNVSTEIFPQNTMYIFRNKLNKQYILNDNWHVALCDIQFFLGEPAVIRDHNVYIFCDIITETQIGNTDEQLLRRVAIREHDVSHDWLLVDFQTKYYIPLKTTALNEIGVTIKHTTPGVPGANKPTSLLLHFKKDI